jgi:membrane-bound lytic murein transglycosylase MltF
MMFLACTNSEPTEEENEGTVPDTVGLMARETSVVQQDSILIAMYRLNKARFGDFDTLFKRRLIRVLIPYSRTLFFNDKGRERGITAEVFRDFEFYLNKKYKHKLRNVPITIVIIPTPRDQLLSLLNQGMGDIAAGNLTVTNERLKTVDFFTSDKEQELFEIPLTRRGVDSLTTPDQLSGRTVHVRKSSSYYEHLQQLNAQLKAKGKAPAKLVIVSENLEDEDLMEMLDAGILSTIVVNRWKSRMWSIILPNIRLNESAAVHSGGHIGWATRKNSPQLIAELNAFYFKYEKPNGIIPYRLKKYAANVKHLQDPTNADNSERYKQIMLFFKKYGGKYGFDPLMLAAQGFQESRLNQNQKSPAGAIGVMQLMPKTGASMKVGNIHITEPNIHAGAKYMNILMTEYFKEAHFDGFNRSLFAFASYNAGPSRIAGLRRIAAARGLNPDVWLNNVELIASEKIGQETTTYVRNIMKYYYSYKLMQERLEIQKEQREAF